ncbi:MAG TPA: ROK family protein [Steroidobacteraceae bacterium]|jgi:glucokinase|nr:ROK family protein [Steroidobacteraceae bacterium]
MILVGDVGGTRTRLALAARAGSSWELTGLEESPTTPDLPEKVARFRAGHRIEAAAFGGAGPVGEDGRIPLTNAGFTLDPVRLGEAAGVSRAVLVNDFRAIAEAIPVLPRDCFVACGGGRAVEGEPVVVMGPGTGLGTSIGAQGPGGWHGIQGEAGHTDLAPVDDEELRIWQLLRREHRLVTAETVLSGPGLERLYAALAGRRLPAPEIDAAAWRGEAEAVAAHTVFTRWLGRVAGNLALAAAARGGVYLAGGILPRWGARFDADTFRRGFTDKAPPYDAWLAEVPSFVVMHPYPGLIGLAVLAGGRR